MKFLISILFVFFSFVFSAQISPNFGKEITLMDPFENFSCWNSSIHENKIKDDSQKLIPDVDIDFSNILSEEFIYGENITFENYNNDNPIGKVFVQTCFTKSVQYGKYEGVDCEIDWLGNIIREYSIKNDTVKKTDLLFF